MARVSRHCNIATRTTAGALLACFRSDSTKRIQPAILKRQIWSNSMCTLHHNAYIMHTSYTVAEARPWGTWLSSLVTWHVVTGFPPIPKFERKAMPGRYARSDLEQRPQGSSVTQSNMNASIYAHFGWKYGTHDPFGWFWVYHLGANV